MTQKISASSIAVFRKMSMGDRLRWLLEDRDVKQTEIAERIGVTQAAISNLVNDSSRKPSAPTLIALCQDLGCNPSWILAGEGDPYGWAPVTAESQVELLNLFKGMTADSKAALLTVARSMIAKK